MNNRNTDPEEFFQEEEETINLRHYWHVVLERRWLIVATFVSVFALSLIYLFKATPIYEATAVIQINPESGNVLNLRDAFAVEGNDQEYMVTQYKNLQSPTLIRTVVDKLKLNESERYREALNPVDAVSEDITISPIRLSRLVEVKAEHPDPRQATNIVNTLVTIFINQNLDKKKEKVLQALENLKEQAVDMKERVRQSDRNVLEYRMEKDIHALKEGENIIQQALLATQQDLANAETRMRTAISVATTAREIREAGGSFETIPQIARDPEVQQLQTELSSLQVELAGLKKRFKDKWPAVQQVRESIEALRFKIAEKYDTLYERILNEAEQATMEVENLKSLLKKREQDSQRLSELAIDYDDLARDRDLNHKLYDLILQSIEETDLAAEQEKQNIEVRDYATLPFKPVKPRTPLILLMGMMGGMALALALAFFVNYLDDSIKSQDDVETYLKLNFLGYIPNIKTNSVVERDLQAHISPQSNAAEGFRTLRAAVTLLPNSDQYKTIAVTSTIPSEGKSLVASNLAIVQAQTGMKTLLVDADLRRPSVHKAFQLHSPVGLSAYLNQEVTSIKDIARSTDVPNLDAVCCGAVPNSPSELISSKNMVAFLEEAANHYDRVILDCPPISAVSDPLVIASRAKGVLFVTKFNKIRREHARRSVQRLHDAGVHILGVVLNDIDFEGKDSYYYSYYYYQNRYYASHYKSKDGDKGNDKGKDA